ncbi:hypothetical protein NDU88_003022 [Pleurodeles waltl]|uniref:Uncharacterized protein n=1 Tax=Pleurodeles waltl TaxID=8319 RepID=A0AAV7M2A5_PLEWA|nr:hypothetical protein NDU88_003022 [Pleurodeles waltl]
MIKSLASADTLTSSPHLQSFPTASIYSYSVRMAPQTRFYPPSSLNYRDIPPLPPYPGPPEPPPPYTEVDPTAAEVTAAVDARVHGRAFSLVPHLFRQGVSISLLQPSFRAYFRSLNAASKFFQTPG